MALENVFAACDESERHLTRTPKPEVATNTEDT